MINHHQKVPNIVNGQISINPVGGEGPGGAHTQYTLVWGEHPEERVHIPFQNGNPHEEGVNGLTNEALLAIVRHRLSGYMGGPFPDPYTNQALGAVDKALYVLGKRTEERTNRGVEGQNVA